MGNFYYNAISTILNYLSCEEEASLRVVCQRFYRLIRNFRSSAVSGLAFISESKSVYRHYLYSHYERILTPNIEIQCVMDDLVSCVRQRISRFSYHLQHTSFERARIGDNQQQPEGLGLFSNDVIPKGNCLFIYTGEMISTKNAKRRKLQRQQDNNVRCFIIYLHCYYFTVAAEP